MAMFCFLFWAMKSVAVLLANCYDVTGDTLYDENMFGFDDGLDNIINSGTLG